MVGEAYSQQPQQEAQRLHPWPQARNRDGEVEMGQAYKLKTAPQWCTSTSKAVPPPTGNKGSSTWAWREQSSLKLPQDLGTGEEVLRNKNRLLN